MNLIDLNKQISALDVGESLRLESVPEDVYHASEGFGSTAIKEANKSLAHLKVMRDGKKEISATLQAIFDLGSATHAAVLEGDSVLNEKFICAPSLDKRTKAGKEAWAELKESGKTVLKAEDWEHVMGMRACLYDHPAANRLLTGGNAEVSYWKRYSENMILKARVDSEVGDLAVDLKTTKDASPYRFKSTVKYDYGLQSALYTMVTGANAFVFVGIEKVPPYAFSIVKQGDDIIEMNQKKLGFILADIDAAIESGLWAGYDNADLHETELTEKELERMNNEQ